MIHSKLVCDPRLLYTDSATRMVVLSTTYVLSRGEKSLRIREGERNIRRNSSKIAFEKRRSRKFIHNMASINVVSSSLSRSSAAHSTYSAAM
jgi:hypothetical protein